MAAIIEFGFNAAAVHSGITKLEQRLSSFDGVMRNVAGKSLLAGAFNLPALGRFGGDLISAAGKMEQYRAALQAVSKDTAPLNEQMARLRQLAKAPGLNFDEAVQGTVRLQATGMSAAEAEKTLKEMANALRSVGGSAEQLDGVTLALSQIMAKGKVSAEEINQIAERMPQIRQLMQNAFGTADTEALQKMGLSSREFISGIVMAMSQGTRVMNGTNSAIEQLLDQWKQLKAAIGAPLASELVPLIKNLTTDIPAFQERVQGVVSGLAELVPSALGVVKVLSRWYLAFKTLQLAKFIVDLQAKRAAIQASAAAIIQETGAVNANTAAQRANAAATTAANAAHAAPRVPGKVSINEGRPVFDEKATMARLTHSGAAYAAGQKQAEQLRSGLITGLGGLGVAAASAYSNSLIPATAAAGTQSAKIFTDTLSMGLVMAGGPWGVALAASMQGAWVFAARKMQAQGDALAAFDANKNALTDANSHVADGEGSKARAVLEQRIAALRQQAASASGTEAEAYRVNIREMEFELSLLPKKIELQRVSVARAEESARIERQTNEMAASRVERMEAMQAAGERLKTLQQEMADQGIDFKPLAEQAEYWSKRIKAGLQQAIDSTNFDSTGVKADIESISSAMAKLQGAGAFISAERLAGALKVAREQAEKLEAVRKKEAELPQNQLTAQDAAKEVKDKAEKARALSQSRAEYGLETAIVRAKIEAGGKDNAITRALEDRLESMKVAQQLENAGIARDKQALDLAKQRVAQQRLLSDLAEKQQRLQSQQDIGQELALLQAKANGQDQLVKKLEREQAIRERALQIEQQAGVTREQARRAAERLQSLQERATARENGEQPGRRKIRGYSTGGLDHDRYGLSGRPGGALSRGGPLSRNGPLTSTGGLAGYNQLQAGEIGVLGRLLGKSGTGMGMIDTRQVNPLAAQAAQNAANQNAPGAGAITEAFLQKIFSQLPPEIAAAIIQQS